MTPASARFARLGLVAVVAMLLAGCATAYPGGSASPIPLASPLTPAGTPSPTPTAACPENPHGDTPPDCVPYDPEWAMAQNDRYRERVDVDADTTARGDELVAPVTAALERLRADDGLTTETVAEAVGAAGAADVQVREDYGTVLFGAAIAGGCLYGSAGADGVSVEVGGFILDGGCLPAQ